MITPLDIENKEFKKGLRGYNENEVDSYLDEIKKEYENLYRENIELKDKLNALTEQIKRYKNHRGDFKGNSYCSSADC
jgi:DivIVA domain